MKRRHLFNLIIFRKIFNIYIYLLVFRLTTERHRLINFLRKQNYHFLSQNSLDFTSLSLFHLFYYFCWYLCTDLLLTHYPVYQLHFWLQTSA